MKTLLIILCIIAISSWVGYFLWQRHSKASLDAEIDRIKIPDDTFDEPQKKGS